MPPSAAPIPRVVIAGAGPAGLAAASLLREAGAIVTVVERTVAGAVSPARRGSVVIGREAWPVLERVGARAILDDTVNVVGPRQQMVSLRRLDSLLSTHAEQQGATILRGAAVDGVSQVGTGGAARVSVGISDARSGARQVLDADWFVDATGGRSPLASDPRFRRASASGAYALHPSERNFFAVQANAQPTRPVGWTAADGSFAINDRVEGIVTAYRSVDGRRASVAPPTATDGAALLRGLGIDPADALGAPRSFSARQSMAPHAADGRLLLAGDSVGTVLPVEQMGTSLALTDAERAATAIIAAHRAPTAELANDIVRRYDTETVALHRAFIR